MCSLHTWPGSPCSTPFRGCRTAGEARLPSRLFWAPASPPFSPPPQATCSKRLPLTVLPEGLSWGPPPSSPPLRLCSFPPHLLAQTPPGSRALCLLNTYGPAQCWEKEQLIQGPKWPATESQWLSAKGSQATIQMPLLQPKSHCGKYSWSVPKPQKAPNTRKMNPLYESCICNSVFLFWGRG